MKKIIVCPVCKTIIYTPKKDALQIVRCSNCKFKTRRLFAEETITSEQEYKFKGEGLA